MTTERGYNGWSNYEVETIEYTVYSLDVWGNEEDGYEVNQMFEEGTLTLPKDHSKSDLLDALRDENYLDSYDAEVEDFANGITSIQHDETGEPLLELRYEI